MAVRTQHIQASANASHEQISSAPIQWHQSDFDHAVCFTGQTHVITAGGEKTVENLQPGDRVLTADNGLQPVRWIGHQASIAKGFRAPVHVPKNTVGANRDLLVSPEYRIVLSANQISFPAKAPVIQARAIDLVGQFGITQPPREEVTYYHLLFDHHEMIFVEGVLSESFHPAFAGLKQTDPATRAQLQNMIPNLRVEPSASVLADSASSDTRSSSAVA